MSKETGGTAACSEILITYCCKANRKSLYNTRGHGHCTYGDLCPGSRRVAMMLRNLSAMEVRIPAKTVIRNVQAANIVSNMLTPKFTSETFPSTEQTESSLVGWLNCLTPSENELTWLTSISFQLKPVGSTLEYDVLDKVDLLGCTN